MAKKWRVYFHGRVVFVWRDPDGPKERRGELAEELRGFMNWIDDWDFESWERVLIMATVRTPFSTKTKRLAELTLPERHQR